MALISELNIMGQMRTQSDRLLRSKMRLNSSMVSLIARISAMYVHLSNNSTKCRFCNTHACKNQPLTQYYCNRLIHCQSIDDLISGILTEVITCDLKWLCMEVHEAKICNLFRGYVIRRVPPAWIGVGHQVGPSLPCRGLKKSHFKLFYYLIHCK